MVKILIILRLDRLLGSGISIVKIVGVIMFIYEIYTVLFE